MVFASPVYLVLIGVGEPCEWGEDVGTEIEDFKVVGWEKPMRGEPVNVCGLQGRRILRECSPYRVGPFCRFWRCVVVLRAHMASLRCSICGLQIV